MDFPKVVGVGLHKSGTSSLAAALYSLGYLVVGHGTYGIDFAHLRTLDRDAGRAYVWSCISAAAEVADAFQDSPWWFFVDELDAAYPDAKFILTTRDRDRWLASVQNHFGRASNRWDDWLFDGHNSVDHPEVYLDRYDQHHAELGERFADRPDALLEIPVTTSLDWEPICAFLGHPIPSYPFPWSNPGDARTRSLPKRVLRRLRQMRDERSGRGADTVRCELLYQRCDTETKRLRRLVSSDQLDTSDLAATILPQIRELKARLGVPYMPDGSGFHGDAVDAVWGRLQFELRHSIGQITELAIDTTVDGRSVDAVARHMLDDVEAFPGS